MSVSRVALRPFSQRRSAFKLKIDLFIFKTTLVKHNFRFVYYWYHIKKTSLWVMPYCGRKVCVPIWSIRLYWLEIQVYVRDSQFRESDNLRSDERQPLFFKTKTHKYYDLKSKYASKDMNDHWNRFCTPILGRFYILHFCVVSKIKKIDFKYGRRPIFWKGA